MFNQMSIYVQVLNASNSISRDNGMRKKWQVIELEYRILAYKDYCEKCIRYSGLEEKYSKTCVKRPLKIDKTKILMTNGSLIKVESIAECSPCNLLQYF